MKLNKKRRITDTCVCGDPYAHHKTHNSSGCLVDKCICGRYTPSGGLSQCQALILHKLYPLEPDEFFDFTKLANALYPYRYGLSFTAGKAGISKNLTRLQVEHGLVELSETVHRSSRLTPKGRDLMASWPHNPPLQKEDK